MSTSLVRSVIYVRGTLGLKMDSAIVLKASKISAKTAFNGTNASMKWLELHTQKVNFSKSSRKNPNYVLVLVSSTHVNKIS